MAKVYFKPPAAELARKLALMVGVKDETKDKLLKLMAWPDATLHRVPGVPVAGLLILGSALTLRSTNSIPPKTENLFPRGGLAQFLVHAALNCAVVSS